MRISVAARAPWLTLAVSALLAGACFVPGLSAELCYEREAVRAGEVWRLATAGLTHFSAPHLVANLAVIAPVGCWIEVGSRRALARTLAWAAAASALLLALSPRALVEFSGASGVALAFTAFAALRGATAGPVRLRVAWSAVLALVLAKLVAESAGAVHVAALAEGVSLWAPSHWAGLAAGAASFGDGLARESTSRTKRGGRKSSLKLNPTTCGSSGPRCSSRRWSRRAR